MNFHPSFQVLRGILLYYLMTSYCIPNAEPSLEGNSKNKEKHVRMFGPKGALDASWFSASFVQIES